MRRVQRGRSRVHVPSVYRDRPSVAFPAFYRPPPVRLTVLEDRRSFHPAGLLRPAGVVSRRDARRIVERAAPKARPLSYRDPFPSLRLGFAVPEKVVRCVRRKQRREVVFALGKTGKGAKARRRRDAFSDIGC